MKLHILKDFVDGPWGGGNQFLLSLRDEWRNRGVYTENPMRADGVLINSHHNLPTAVMLKYIFPKKSFIHRMDGPINLTRKNGQRLDDFIFYTTGLITDGVIFQSPFSKGQCLESGMSLPSFEATIINAPDPNIFYPLKGHELNTPISLIATSWSSNPKKGFDIYDFLDKNLDFKRFKMTFVGNSNIPFKNIEFLPPKNRTQLAGLLRQHDIFITASRDDPCSNSLVEGLHCGLPAVARNSGGHPFIVGDAGVLFNDETDVIDAINKVADNYDFYRNRITLPDIGQVADKYYNVFRDAMDIRRSGDTKRLSLRSLTSFYLRWGRLRANRVI